MEILHRDDLPPGGLAGLREHRLMKDTKVFSEQRGTVSATFTGEVQLILVHLAR